jgi:hypothetical protein
MVPVGKLLVSQLVEGITHWNTKSTYRERFTVLRNLDDSTLENILNCSISARRLTSFSFKMNHIVSSNLRRNLLNDKFESCHPVVFY